MDEFEQAERLRMAANVKNVRDGDVHSIRFPDGRVVHLYDIANPAEELKAWRAAWASVEFDLRAQRKTEAR
jgi:hypothetical protein